MGSRGPPGLRGEAETVVSGSCCLSSTEQSQRFNGADLPGGFIASDIF